MIITAKEVGQFAKRVEAFEKYQAKTSWLRELVSIAQNDDELSRERIRSLANRVTPEEWDAIGADREDRHISAHLAANPHLLIPCGFDEVRIEPEPVEAVLSAFRQRFPKASAEGIGFSLVEKRSIAFYIGLRCRDAASGVWYSYGGFREEVLRLRSQHAEEMTFSLREILAACKKAISEPVNLAVLTLPNLWRPPDCYPRIELIDTANSLICALQANRVGYGDLTWRQFEEVVAELLKGRGLDVEVTPRSSDGGRDVIARGELIPGEPCVLAVEVKHKGVVRIDDLRSRLQANQYFPGLLFVTSGRFSAGVIQEKKRPENFLRLLLKDGVALRDWISAYGVKYDFAREGADPDQPGAAPKC